MATQEDVSRLVWGALMPGVSGPSVEPWQRAAFAAGVESVCLFAGAVGSPSRVAATVRALHRVAPGVLVATDEEGGEVTRVEAVAGSSLLSARALGIIDDLDVTRAQARLQARLLRQVGVHWTFAPVADVNVDPRNPVIGVRSFGPDAGCVGAHVAAAVEGLQRGGIVATAKHFPGHGDTHVDSHEDLPTLDVDAETLDARELVPFRHAIAAGVASVMTGHLRVPVLDADLPVSLSRAATTGLLREQLGYTGVVVTDAVEMGAVSGPGRERLAAAVVSALLAGADVVCLGADDQERALADSAAAVLTAVADGTLPIALLERAAQRRAMLRTVTARADRETDRAAGVDADIDLVASAAPRGLLVDGDVVLSTPGVDVLTVAARPGYAAGPTGWRLAPRLAAADLDVHEVSSVPARDGRGLVIEVRDAWKDPALADALAGALAARPDAIVVDVGWPTPLDLPVRGYLATHGTGALAATVAAQLIAGGDAVAAAASLIHTSQLEA